MKLFNNEVLQTEIKEFDFGIVKAGESKQFDYWLHNETAAKVINIELDIANKEVSVITAPKELLAGQKAKVSVIWKPSITVRQGLKSLLKIKASELWS